MLALWVLNKQKYAWACVCNRDSLAALVNGNPQRVASYCIFFFCMICGRRNHYCFTTRLHLLTTPWASGSSWSIRTSPYWHNLPIHLIMPLFSKLKGIIKWTRFVGIKATKRVVTTKLRGTHKNPSNSAEKREREGRKSALNSWGGDYLEGKTIWSVVWYWNKLFVTLVPLLFRHTSYIYIYIPSVMTCFYSRPRMR